MLLPGRGEVFVRDTGHAGPAVLLLHGFGRDRRSQLLQRIPGSRWVSRRFALDRRGHGRGLRTGVAVRLQDCADDAAALLEVLDIDRAVVVGYSMGGPIALLLATRHRERGAGLVLQATALEFHSETGERALWRGMTVIEAALRHGHGDGVVRRILRETVDREPSLTSLRPWLAGEFGAATSRASSTPDSDLSQSDASQLATTLALPSAVVVARRDRLVPPHKQRALATAIDATVFELPGDHDSCLVAAAQYGP